MTEKSYYRKLKAHYTALAEKSGRSYAIEAKFTRSNILPFSCLPTHQEDDLLSAEEALAVKERDVGLHKKSVDIIIIANAISLIIAIYYKPRAEEIFAIPARAFLKEKYESKEKSLHITRAREIGREIII